MNWVNRLIKRLPGWVQGAIGLIVFLGAFCFWCDTSRAHPAPFLIVWCTIPFLAYCVWKRMLDGYLTESGFKTLRVWAIIFAVLLSMCVTLQDEQAKFIARHFFPGSKMWYADEGDTDDNGNSVYSREAYSPTFIGRFVLRQWFLIFGGASFLFITFTVKCFSNSIEDLEQARLRSRIFDKDGVLIEELGKPVTPPLYH